MQFERCLLSVSLLLSFGCEAKPAATAPVVPAPATAMGERPPVVHPAPKALLARLPDSDEGGSAAAVGTLRVKDGCVSLERPDGTLMLATTNPKLRWDDAAQQLELDGMRYTPGSTLRVGGMQATADVVKTLSWQTPPLVGCAGEAVWITSTVNAAP